MEDVKNKNSYSLNSENLGKVAGGSKKAKAPVEKNTADEILATANNPKQLPDIKKEIKAHTSKNIFSKLISRFKS